MRFTILVINCMLAMAFLCSCGEDGPKPSPQSDENAAPTQPQDQSKTDESIIFTATVLAESDVPSVPVGNSPMITIPMQVLTVNKEDTIIKPGEMKFWVAPNEINFEPFRPPVPDTREGIRDPEYLRQKRMYPVGRTFRFSAMRGDDVSADSSQFMSLDLIELVE